MPAHSPPAAGTQIRTVQGKLRAMSTRLPLWPAIKICRSAMPSRNAIVAIAPVGPIIAAHHNIAWSSENLSKPCKRARSFSIGLSELMAHADTHGRLLTGARWVEAISDHRIGIARCLQIIPRDIHGGTLGKTVSQPGTQLVPARCFKGRL